MMLLDGREILSAFRRDRLNERLGGSGGPVCVTAARVVYALDGIDAAADARLATLLDAVGVAAALTADDVRNAFNERTHRASQEAEQVREEILEGMIFIADATVRPVAGATPKAGD